MIYRVSSHTNTTGPETTYVAIVGTNHNGIDFIPQAIERGATKIVMPAGTQLSQDTAHICSQKNITLEYADDTRKALALYAARAYDEPAKKLNIIGVTGTDGKTTSCYLMYHILKAAGVKTALLTGVEIIIDGAVMPAQLTTAKPDFLHYFFHQCVQKNITHVVMEVSAQAHSLNRIDGIEFNGLIFTNLAKEHGELYHTLNDYFDAKCAIIRQLKPNAPLIVNSDNEWGQKIKQLFPNAYTCGITTAAQYGICIKQESINKQVLEISHKRQPWPLLTTSLIGEYNALNILGTAALADQLGISFKAMSTGTKDFIGAPGRMQKFYCPNGALTIIDYAHTPQAFQAMLPVLRRYAKNLFVIFGAGGNKDKQKRPLMGKIAACYADCVVLTNDNPRQEDQYAIMDAVMADVTKQDQQKFIREPDRALAIINTYKQAKSGDIIAVLGKGVEEEQIIGSRRIAHSDIQIVQKLTQN